MTSKDNSLNLKKLNNIDAYIVRLTEWVIRFRWLVIGLALMAMVAVGYGATTLQVENNYRALFSKSNPQLQTFEDFQATYTKNDNLFFTVIPKSGDVFTSDILMAITKLTEGSWRLPYASRVDSLNNFQHTKAYEDDLIVEDLFDGSSALTQEFIESRRKIALAEPLLRDQLVTGDSLATAVNVTLQYPGLRVSEVPEAVTAALSLRDEVQAAHPDATIWLSGVSMLNYSMAESGRGSMAALIPVTFAMVLVLSMLALRSVSATLVMFVIIVASTVIALGTAGYIGFSITPISAVAPVVVLTLAVADSIHILISLRVAMSEGMGKLSALADAMRTNFVAVAVTSLTTIVGFLALNFSDSPPFHHLGNIAAIGIAAAWIFSITLLPALVSLIPMKAGTKSGLGPLLMGQFADFVLRRHKALALGSGIFALSLILLIPLMEFNDTFTKYFDDRLEFRRAVDATEPYFGAAPIEISIPAAGTGGVSDPEYLRTLEAFTQYLRDDVGVRHVYAITDIMKRLNRNMHGDHTNAYKLPENRELAAQYLLLYELSLPYGLDLNDRINIDKSASRVTINLKNPTTIETKAFLSSVENWLRENAPDYMKNAEPTGAYVMFTFLSQRNVESMIKGTIIAIAAIGIILMFALRSVGLGLLSLIPNSLPILSALGAWAIIVGEVGMSVAVVASLSLGIVVDDTVHFLTKYRRARILHDLSTPAAIRYSFIRVGPALVINTFILAAGFSVLVFSSFKLTTDMGLLTMLAIVFALLFDFLLLPGLLLWFGGKNKTDIIEPEKGELNAASQAI